MPLQPRARITGGVYLVFFLTAILGAIVMPGTASSILAHESLFRLGYALTLISTASYVALAALFYQLFRPVSRTIALMAVVFNLMGSALAALQSVFQLASVAILGGGAPGAFKSDQLQALAQMVLDMGSQAGNVAIVFFGVFNLLVGYLIYRSTFMPRILGVLMAASAPGWLIFLYPPLANYLLTPIEVIGFVAEAVLMLWLLVRGVNAQRWREQGTLTQIG